MAKSNDDDQFLGGGLKFNSVGVGKRPTEEEAATGDETGFKFTGRTLAIILVVIVLIVMLYYVVENGFGGVQVRQGISHAQPTDTGAPPANF